MSKKDWTDQLPELFEGYAEAEPEGLWEAVQGAMAPKRRKAAAAWWWYGAAALAAAACVAVGVFLFRKDHIVISSEVEKSLAVVDVHDNPESEEELPINHQQDSLASLTQPLPLPSASSLRDNLLSTGPSPYSCPGVDTPADGSSPIPDSSLTGSEIDNNDNIIDNNTVAEEGNKQEVKDATKNRDRKEDENQVEHEREIDESDFWKEEPAGKNKVRKPTELRVKAGLSSGQYLAQDVTRTTTGYGLPVSYPGMPMSKAAQSNSGLSPMMLSRNKPSITDAQHHRSSRFGITLGASFGRHWGMESGIYLTTLRSTYASESGAARSTTEREMRYIGFPLHLQYRIWWYGKFSVYGVAGPMFETAYRTRTTTVQTLGGHQEHKTDRTRISDNRWSVQAGAGAQLEFLPGTSLFLQPSLSWHIPNGNGLENAYSEHPFSPEFFFGVRFSFL